MALLLRGPRGAVRGRLDAIDDLTLLYAKGGRFALSIPSWSSGDVDRNGLDEPVSRRVADSRVSGTVNPVMVYEQHNPGRCRCRIRCDGRRRTISERFRTTN